MYRFLLLLYLLFSCLLTQAAAPPPGNDDPCNAIPLNVGTTCNYIQYTNAAATATNGIPAPVCANYLGGDVWFSVIVPASGIIIIDTNIGNMTDGGMALYSGTNCNNLYTLLACDDDGSSNGNMPSISQTGLTPGVTVYIRVWEYGNDNNGTFSICVKSGVPCTSSTTNSSCTAADPFCTGVSYDYCNTTNVASIGQGLFSTSAGYNPIYGCLGSSPNPAFYFMNIANTGPITFNISQQTTAGVGIDVDYIVWGPFSSQAAMCGGLAANNIVSCSYSTAAVETASIPNAQAGQYYMVLITNFSNQQGVINFSQTNASNPGAGTTNCNIMTAVPDTCSGGNFTLTGSISVPAPPSSGNLTITNSCGGSQVINAPFSPQINYSIPNICGNGGACNVTAVFSAAGAPTILPATYTAPSCNTLTVSPGTCNGSNQYVLSGTLTTGCLPTTGTLTITNSCGSSAVFNAPFTNPLNWSLPASSGNGGSCTVTAVYSAAGAPIITPLTFTEPTCCGANAGTVNVTVTGGIKTVLPNGSTQVALCQNGTVSLTSAGNYTLPTTPGCASCLQELMYVIYSSAGPTGPNPSVDPNWTGYFWTGQDFPGNSTQGFNTNIAGDCSSLLNLPFTSGFASINDPLNTLVFVPITADNGDNEVTNNGLGFDTNGDGCYDIGDAISITYLNPIRISASPSCNGSVSLDINGGYPEFLNGLYTITNTGAGTLSSNLATAGGNITISGLMSGQAYSISVSDGTGCAKTYSGVYSGPPIINLTPTTQTICPGKCVPLSATINSGVANNTITYSNNTCNIVPDAGANANISTGTWATSAISISGYCGSNFTTGNTLNVCLDISHTYVADLNIFLQAPNGSIVELSTDNGGAGANYNGTCFSMTAGTAITTGTAPFSSTYRPEGNFSTFNGTPINGRWNLWVSDDFGGFTGSLLSWSITFANQNTYTYVWSPTSGLSATNILNPQACPSSTTTYTLTATNSCGCSSSSSTTITVDPLPVAPTVLCYETATWNPVSCQYDITGTQPTRPTTACYETATFNTSTCQWVVTGTQPTRPTTACYETATFNTSTCQWVVTGTQPTRPTTACYETATFNSTSCQWVVTGTQPNPPTVLCYETATWNPVSCQYDITGTQPTRPTTTCYETATFNSTSCQWVVTGTQPNPPTVLCYETATWNPVSCQYDITGTQPTRPTTTCYETATFNSTSCQWVVTGTQPNPPTVLCYETATWNPVSCQYDITGTQPTRPTTACYETATFNTTSCQWVVTGTQPTRPTTACYETATFNTTSCQWVVTGTQPTRPTTACYETATFNSTSCQWVVTGTQPNPPTVLCYETATWNPVSCQYDITGTQPTRPTTACYETATFNTTSCQWVVTGTQPNPPTVLCYETATWNPVSCQYNITGTQPTRPTTACYETATFNTTSCQWVVTGTQPTRPTTACYETATFNSTSCQWVVTGTQPNPPTVLCYETATWNPVSCQYDITGTQPTRPTTACYETATFNSTSCQWVVTGTQPNPPTVLCYETATWNPVSCQYDITGTQPTRPTTACYETATFNTTSCQWVVTGTQPTRPTTACYETATFNSTSCQWVVTGTQPNPPTVLCYETATWNPVSCQYDITGTQPTRPTTACYETATFNSTSCQWVVTGTQPNPPTVLCYETATWNPVSCQYDITGTQPTRPTTACYETATFNTTSCQWVVTGTQPTRPTTACYETATFNSTSCQWVVTGTQPNPPTVLCYETATWNPVSCQYDITGTQPTRPTTACYETATFNSTSCQWVVTGTQPIRPTTACYETATFNSTSCQWIVTGTQPTRPTTACYETATFNTTSCQWVVTGTQPNPPTVLCYQTATWNPVSCQYDITGTQPNPPTVLCYQTATWNPVSCQYDTTGTQPDSPIFTPVTPICSGEVLSPLPTISNNGIAGTWSPALNNTTTTTYTFTPALGACALTSTLTITVYSLPQINSINPMYYCDPNNDGFGVFDLTQVIPTVTGGTSYPVTFHETITDAQIGGTTIPNPFAYYNIDVDNQTIYIRVESTESSSCFKIITLDLIVNPTPEATEPDDYHVCDTDNDGFASFNLTTAASQVFGSINQATHTIAYYTNLANAQSATNPIGNLTNFINQTINSQTIWIRVTNTANGCYDIVTLQLFVDPLPLATQPNYPPYTLCDDHAPSAFEEFDLGSKIPVILLGQTGVNVTFHFSQADALADINPLPLLYTNVAPNVQTLWIRVENTNTGCFVLSTIDIRVEPLPSPIPPSESYTICDSNQDGFGTFDLNTLTADILQGANYTISYHETSDDAQLGNNPLVSPYDNITPFVQFIYALAVDNVNGCRNIIPVELNVNPQPVTPFTVPDLVQCDEDSNPQNLSMVFDLTQNDAAVLAIQPLPASNYTVTYYISRADALAGLAPIIPATHYVGANNEIIWVRVENNNSRCFSIGSFALVINPPLAFTTPAPLSICDDDANPNNLYTVFDLTVKNNEITGGLPNTTVTYYTSYPVTASSVAITNPTTYTNAVAAVQTLGVMVTNAQGCRSYTSLDIRVLPIPTPRTNGIRPLPAKCDVNNTGDMLETFNLTLNASIIINGDPTLTLHYYPTQADALAATNEILNPTAALVGANVWIRVENNRVDYLGNRCFVLVEQPLTVNPLPTIIQSLTVQNCDDNTDGQAPFNLTSTTADLLGSAQLPADFTITYYTNAPNAQSGTGAIANPTTFINANNPQNIFVRVVNNATGCFSTGQFTLVVNPKPTATAPAAFASCDSDGTNDGFFTLDLGSYIAGIIGTQTGVTTTFYDTQTDAINETNAILNLANYQAFTHTVWIRVENNTTGCYQLAPLQITVEPLAEPVISSPNDTICVDFTTNTLLSGVTLDSGISNSNHTFIWSLGGTAIPGATASTYTVTTVAAGDYTVVATSTSLLACVSNPSNPFTLIQSGPPQFADPPYTISNPFNDNQVITVNVVGFGVYQYSLDDGPFQTSNVFDYATLGEHTITVRDVEGTISCGEITLDGIQTIDYPYYFTPNGDGINDTWNVIGLENQPFARLYIFDRYGKLLKQLSTAGPGWDGTYNGYVLPADDYWFKVEYLDQTKTRWKEFKSHFTLKR